MCSAGAPGTGIKHFDLFVPNKTYSKNRRLGKKDRFDEADI